MDDLEIEPCEYFNGKTDTPIYSTERPSVHQIFQLCRGILPENTICSKRLYGVKKTATFIFNQSISKIVHQYDLELDDSLGASIKKEFVGFYEVHDESNIIKISSEIKPDKSSNGRIIGGTFNIRQGSEWLTKQAEPKKMYVLIRRISEDKKMQRKW